ncbi:MAG TPA: hypothetical protein VEW91_10105 [bacterium]|nr:hypothetical protein [bacterium]
MSTIADVSLAIIAATCIISVVAFIVLVVLVWRVTSRVQAMLALIHRALPELVTDTRAILAKVDREIVGEVARAVTHVSAAVGSGVSAFEQVQTTARRVAEDIILPQMATAAGLWAAVREGLAWLRPGGDGKRR